MTPDELKQHPSYPELLAVDGHNLLGRLDALEQQVNGLTGQTAALLDLLKSTMQQVNDLQAQLASHETAPYPHGRYFMGAIGEIVLDSLETALDYDPRDEMDVPITDDAQAAACELTAEQRARIWQRVNGETA